MSQVFALPDLSQTEDKLFAATLVSLVGVTGGANIFRIPFFHRAGGLLTYSKFAMGANFGLMVPSRLGMSLLYMPAGIWGAYYLVSAPGDATRADLVAKLMVAHFAKRTLECCFLHSYSGDMPLASSAFIASFYTIVSVASIHFARVVPQDIYQSWTLGVGLGLFALGQAGNFYHHYLLATLRKPGDKGYKVPRGGLFESVACPHYLFELLSWFGAAVCSQHSFNLGIFVGMVVYLADRAIGQSEWNRKKIPGYPKGRKHLVPFLF